MSRAERQVWIERLRESVTDGRYVVPPDAVAGAICDATRQALRAPA